LGPQRSKLIFLLFIGFFRNSLYHTNSIDLFNFLFIFAYGTGNLSLRFLKSNQ